MATTTTSRAPARFRFSFVDTFLWAVRIGAVILIVWGVVGAIALSLDGQGLRAAAWRDLFVTGIAQGSMYGLIALGYSMVYGVLGFINFAHGEVFMTGAFAGFFAADALANAGMWERNPIIAILIVLAVSTFTSGLVAVLVERIAYRSLRGSPRLIPLITSIGMSFFLQYSVRALFGSGTKSYPPAAESLTGTVSVLGREIIGGNRARIQLLVIVVAALAMVGLYQFVERSKTGRAMRAVAEDKEIAALMGIDVDRTIVTTFLVGGVMAGVAGTLWGLLFRNVFFFTGFLPGVKAFTAAVLGGIGNMLGAYLGGLTLGIFESLGPQVVLGGWAWELSLILLLVAVLVASLLLGLLPKFRTSVMWQWSTGAVAAFLIVALIVPGLRSANLAVDIPGVSQLKDVVAFTALVLVLIFRPTGLLGERLSVEDRA